jgi:hypothetical protein
MPSFYIVLERQIPKADLYVEGNFLSRNSEELDKLAKQLDIKPLLGFFSISTTELSSLLETHWAEFAKRNPDHAEKWFTAEDGLNTVNALLESLAGSGLTDRDRIGAELREFARVLELAKANQIGWYLGIDY